LRVEPVEDGGRADPTALGHVGDPRRGDSALGDHLGRGREDLRAADVIDAGTGTQPPSLLGRRSSLNADSNYIVVTNRARGFLRLAPGRDRDAAVSATARAISDRRSRPASEPTRSAGLNE